MRVFLLLVLIPAIGSGQSIIEHLYETSKTYNPWFGKESGALLISLEMNYREGGDSSMYAAISINQNKLKLAGTSTGIAFSSSSGLLGALAAGMAVSKSYSLQNAQGVAIFDKISYDSLISILQKLRRYARENIAYSKTLLFRVNKVVLGLDMQNEIDKAADRPRIITKKTYYLQIEDANYRLSESEFDDLADKTLIPLQKSFEAFVRHEIILPQRVD